MKQSINKSQFRDAFLTWNTYSKNFSYEGLGLLYDGLEELASDTGNEYELDVVALCCEFAEDNYHYIASQYNINLHATDDAFQSVLEYLQDNTLVMGYDESSDIIIYQQF
jgi:hypothetical protein